MSDHEGWYLNEYTPKPSPFIPVRESCREWVEEKVNRCGEPAEWVLWGKLFNPDALGPRCHAHAVDWMDKEHCSDFLYRPDQYAIIDLRNLYRKVI